MAAGVVPAASGGDGTGSIRVPASCCGLVGLKPRRGRTSFAPDAGHGLEGLVNEHALTRTVRDSAALLDVVAGSAPGDPYSAPPPDSPFLAAIAEQPAAQRILTTDGLAVPRHADPSRGGRRRRARSAKTLAGLGHHVDAGAPTIDPDAVADAIAVLHTVSNAELHAFATEHLGREPREDEFEASTWVMVREGFETTGVAYAAAIGAVHAQTRRFAAGMADHDVLLVPTLLTPPPPYGLLDQPRGTTRKFFDVEFATTGWTTLANVTGWAAISLPLGVSSRGLPIGVQLMAPDETILLQLARQLELATPWSRPRPAGLDRQLTHLAAPGGRAGRLGTTRRFLHASHARREVDVKLGTCRTHCPRNGRHRTARDVRAECRGERRLSVCHRARRALPARRRAVRARATVHPLRVPCGLPRSALTLSSALRRLLAARCVVVRDTPPSIVTLRTLAVASRSLKYLLPLQFQESQSRTRLSVVDCMFESCPGRPYQKR